MSLSKSSSACVDNLKIPKDEWRESQAHPMSLSNRSKIKIACIEQQAGKLAKRACTALTYKPPNNIPTQ